MERLDCSRNLMQLHEGLLYFKWTETEFSYNKLCMKKYRLIQVYVCNAVL